MALLYVEPQRITVELQSDLLLSYPLDTVAVVIADNAAYIRKNPGSFPAGWELFDKEPLMPFLWREKTRVQNGAARAWARVGVSGGSLSIAQSHNVSGVVDIGVGEISIVFDAVFANANWVPIMFVERASTLLSAANVLGSGGKKSEIFYDHITLECWDDTPGFRMKKDPDSYGFVGFETWVHQ